MERDRGGRPRYPGIITPAEQQVLEELRKGGTNAEIAIRRFVAHVRGAGDGRGGSAGGTTGLVARMRLPGVSVP